MNNLTLRIITGAILAAFSLYLTYLGGIAFKLFCLLLAALVYSEYQTIVNKYYSTSSKIASWMGFIILIYLVFFNYAFHLILYFLLGYCLFLLLLELLQEQKFDPTKIWVAFGFFYSLIGSICLININNTNFGFVKILYLFSIVWCSDIGGYFFGKKIGGKKLAAKISPNKTWSGAIGGIFLAIILSILINFFVSLGGNFIVLTIALSIISQLGDLFESFIKRKFSVKDSGNILPGHGGVLDRVDGLIFAACAFLLFLSFR